MDGLESKSNVPTATDLEIEWRELKEQEAALVHQRRIVEGMLLLYAEEKTEGTSKIEGTNLRVTFKENRRWDQKALSEFGLSASDPFRMSYSEDRRASKALELLDDPRWKDIQRAALTISPGTPYFSLTEKK